MNIKAKDPKKYLGTFSPFVVQKVMDGLAGYDGAVDVNRADVVAFIEQFDRLPTAENELCEALLRDKPTAEELAVVLEAHPAIKDLTELVNAVDISSAAPATLRRLFQSTRYSSDLSGFTMKVGALLLEKGEAEDILTIAHLVSDWKAYTRFNLLHPSREQIIRYFGVCRSKEVTEHLAQRIVELEGLTREECCSVFVMQAQKSGGERDFPAARDAIVARYKRFFADTDEFNAETRNLCAKGNVDAWRALTHLQ